MTSVVCGCTISVSSRKMLSVVNMCAVIVQQMAIELCLLNDVLVCVFMHFNCLRSCEDAIIPVPDLFSTSHLASFYRHVDFDRAIVSRMRRIIATSDFITGKVRADAINGRCQLIGGTVPYVAMLKSWMADSSTARDRPCGQNTAIIGKFTLRVQGKSRVWSIGSKNHMTCCLLMISIVLELMSTQVVAS